MEKALALPTQALASFVPHGLHKINEAQLLACVAQYGQYHDRAPALETNPNLKQPIPYVVARCQGKVFIYQRTAKQEEQRLHAKYSIGFGGHINPEDAQNNQNPILTARNRELSEEVTFSSTPQFDFIGTINISKAPVDQFHLGVAYTAEVATPNYTLNETAQFQNARWATPQEIASLYDKMESWSQEVFTALYPTYTPVAQNV